MNIILPAFCIVIAIMGVAVHCRPPGSLAVSTKPYFGSGGNSKTVQATNTCQNVDAAWNDKINAIDIGPNDCVILYDAKDCAGGSAGRSIRLKNGDFGTGDLADVNMKDNISSYKLCK